MNKFVIKSIWFFCGVFLSSCGINHIHESSSHYSEEQQFLCSNLIQGEEYTNICAKKLKGKLLAQRNKDVITNKYLQEFKYLNWKTPKLGLALSGGGTRSASFSIGVMKALEENDILKDVEIISSVSGGSYASYWYLSQLFYNLNNTDIHKDLFYSHFDKHNNLKDDYSNCTSTNLSFADCYKYQFTLENSSKILSFSKKPGIWSDIKNAGQTTLNIAAQTLSIPIHLFFDSVFDGEYNISPYRHFYQNGLERTYGYVPQDALLTNFENDESFPFNGFMPRVNATQLSFKELREKAWNGIKTIDELNKKLPLFVINTTGRYDDRLFGGRSHDNYRSVEKEVFEFTPWHCGSILFTFKDVEDCGDISWSKATSISGAALNSSESKIDSNGNKIDDEFSELAWAWAFNAVNLDLGYHIGNYNTDSEQKILHRALPFPLYSIHDFFLSSDELEKDQSSSIYLSDGGASENLGLFSLIQRSVDNIIVVDAEHDPNSSFEAANSVKNAISNYGLKFTLEQDKPINVYDATPDEAVMKGKITGLVDEEGKPKTINLVYVKLAVKKYKQGNEEVNYPYSVKNFMEIDKKFPHDSTKDISYEAAQYEAYRDLGYMLGKKIVFCDQNIGIERHTQRDIDNKDKK